MDPKSEDGVKKLMGFTNIFCEIESHHLCLQVFLNKEATEATFVYSLDSHQTWHALDLTEQEFINAIALANSAIPALARKYLERRMPDEHRAAAARFDAEHFRGTISDGRKPN